MGALPSKSKATPAAVTSPAPPWPDLPPEPACLVLRRLSSGADRFCFALVCRQWERVARHFWSDWSTLPPELIGLVLRRLSADSDDRRRLAAVCRRWRHAERQQCSSRWSAAAALPPELADLVLRRLSSHADRVRFAAVCHHWRHVAREYSPTLPPALPWLVSCFGAGQSLPDGKVYFLRRRELQCYGCFDNWLMFKAIGRSRHFLENPHTGETMELPEQCNEPVHVYYDGSHGPSSNLTSASFDIDKVIVCSNDLIAAIVKYGYRQVVVCCRPGMSSWSTGLSRSSISPYQDLVIYKGKLYAVANGGDLFEHEVSEDSDTGELRVSRIKQVVKAPPPLDGYYQAMGNAVKCYLVISCTCKLLLVRWFVPSWVAMANPANDLMLKVFEADLEMSQWVEVENLHDQVLFVSSRCSKAISTASTHDPYLQGNKIYAIDDGIMFWHFWPKQESCTCVYDMSSKTINPISLGESLTFRLEAAWFFP